MVGRPGNEAIATVKTEISVVVIKSVLFHLNVRHGDATVSWLQLLFTMTYWSLGAIQCSREYKKFLKSITLHFNCSFMQLEQQTSGHNNIPLLGVSYRDSLEYLFVTQCTG